MKDYQRIEKELKQLASIERTEMQKAETWEKIQSKIRKQSFLIQKPIIAGFATVTTFLIVSILVLSFFAEYKQVSPMGESNKLVLQPDLGERQEEVEKKEGEAGKQLENFVFPEEVELTFRPIEFEELVPFMNNNNWKFVGSSDSFQFLTDDALKIHYYLDEAGQRIYGVLVYQDQFLRMEYLTDIGVIDNIATYIFNISYPTDSGELYFVGAFGSYGVGYEYIFYNTTSGKFMRYHNNGYPIVADIGSDGIQEIFMQSEYRAMNPASIEVLRFHNNRFEKVSISSAIREQDYNEERTFSLASVLLPKLNVVGIDYFDYKTSLSSQLIYEFTDETTIQLSNILLEMTDEQLLDYSKMLWEYELSVNKKPVPVDGIVETEAGLIEIIISERQPEHLFIPYEIFYRAMLSGNYREHLFHFQPEPDERTGADGTIVTSEVFRYENVESGSVIEFSITDELRNRLGLETNKVKIYIQ